MEKKVQEFLVAAGTYDGFFCGWIWEPETGDLVERFSVTDHAGPMTAVATCNTWLLSGGVDENIRVYDAQLFKGFGALSEHKATVSCLRFHKSAFLATGDHSGLVMYSACSKVRFQLQAAVQVHAGAVHDCDFQPKDARLLLSVGADRRLKLTNCASQRTVDSRRFQEVPTLCRYSPAGRTYCVGFEKSLRFFNAEERSDQPLGQYSSKEAIHCMCFVDEGLLAIGCENKEVRILRAPTGAVLCTLAQHLNRVKGIASCVVAENFYTIASVDSDGKLILSKLSAHASPSTPTPSSIANKKRPRESEKGSIVWERDLKGTYVPYPPELSNAIEEAFQAKAKSFELPGTSQAHFVLDLQGLTQTNLTARPKRARAIRRTAVRSEPPVAIPELGPPREWALEVVKTRKISLRFTCLTMGPHVSRPRAPKPSS